MNKKLHQENQHKNSVKLGILYSEFPLPLPKNFFLMRPYPIILSIAGSDCSGGAGIQADIKTISALRGYAASVITAVTVQNTLGVQAVYPTPPAAVKEQLEAVMDDLQPDAVKIGMIHDIDIVHTIARCLATYKPHHVVYDPVMVSSSGRALITDNAVEEICQTLFPLTTLITPNLNEVFTLTGHRLHTPDEMVQEASRLTAMFRTSVLIKGGHLEGNTMCDVLHTLGGDTYIYKERKIESRNLHGTGCTLSSAIATFLAKGLPMDEAVRRSKAYISLAIAAGRELNIGHGNGPLWHFVEPTTQK